MSLRSCFLIDDDEDDREIFALALKKAKAEFVCTMAKNGKEALLHASKGDFVPGYIFVDLNMPMISGRECVAELKKIDRLADVPVIVYTTSSFDKDIEDLKKMGVNHYLVKPRSFSALATILKTLFTKKELPFLLTSEL
ncbi:response regulator [Flavobacterium sp. NRK1]|uniref:response regulator n=1 Tax=Flavobacterium sp. NRK1 TaxID=2954929 RepID=UPI0020920EA1|nr:response regulator [Flavobacterium sp. NRK1]MCO6147475.1 response regulator [Flavobacterium sp. NRK1]